MFGARIKIMWEKQLVDPLSAARAWFVLEWSMPTNRRDTVQTRHLMPLHKKKKKKKTF